MRATEANYRELFDNSSDGILILDAETGRIADVNPSLAELTGCARDDFLGKRLPEVAPFKEIDPTRVFATGPRGDAYVRYEAPTIELGDGKRIDLEFVSNAYIVDDRKVIHCNVRDVTQRKSAELERARLAAAIEQAAEAVMITDAQGSMVYVNPAFETTTGYSRAEAVGRNPNLLKSGLQSAGFYRALWATISGGSTWRGRLVNKKKDGTIYTEDATISPVRDAGGGISSYVAVKRDLTGTLALEAQLLQAQKMEAVGRLAGGVAHDFNNVLSVILSHAELIADDLAPDAPLRADIEEIRTAAVRATELTRQLLAFSRQQVLEAKVLDLGQTVSHTERMLRRLLGADVELTVLSAPGLWSVKADPGQVEQVLMNLAVNARDAMPKGGKLTIETTNVSFEQGDARVERGVRGGSYVLLAVSDTGMGMDEATRARVFEPFFTTKALGKGTGLGLATVFGIVRQSGGHISVRSEVGSGATFEIYFPRVGESADVRSSQRPAPEGLRGTETILLVEDDNQVRAVAAGILRRRGYVVLEAPNGGEALLICEQHASKIDLLLTDVVLPRMSGHLLAERLASLRPEMKVLFMSGHTSEAVAQYGVLDSGAVYLQKPLTPTSLTTKVREALSGGNGDAEQ